MLVFAAGALVLALPAAAWAHAYVVSTTPASNAVVASSPPTVKLVFSEPITISPGALGVYDANGAHVDGADVVQSAGDTIAVSIPRSLPRGTFTVAWRVTSADTHVVHGAFTFSVGAPGRTGDQAAKLLARGQIPGSVANTFLVVRFASFLLLLLCGGGATALAIVLGGAHEAVRRRIARVLAVCGVLLALVTALGLPLEAAEMIGSGFGGGFGEAALEGVRNVRFGQVWLARAWLAILFAALALTLEHGRARRLPLREWALAVVGVALLVTPSAAGHAGADGAFTFAVDLTHVLAASVWLGGLAFVAYALLRSPAVERWELAARIVPRFSAIAVGAVALLLVAGVTNAYLEVRAWDQLWGSAYGRLVLVKAALVLPLLALGAFNNRVSVPRLRARNAASGERRRFLRAIGIELALLVAVVGVTAFLVSEPPARNGVARTANTTITTRIGPFRGRVEVTPGTAGANTFVLEFTTVTGRPATLAQVDVSATLPRRSIGPIRSTATRLAPGRFRVTGVPLAIPGFWRVQVTVRQGEIDEWQKTISLSITKGTTP